MNKDYLYHYTGLANLEKILTDKHVSLMATRYGFFSDKLEFVWALSHIKPYLPGIAEQAGMTHDSEHKVHAYVASLSTLEDNLNMWRLYGHDGMGISLIFDREKLEEYVRNKVTDQFIAAMPVFYANDDNLSKVITDTYKLFVDNYGSVNDICNDVCEAMAFVKSENYRSESEYRLARFAYDGFYANVDKNTNQPITEDFDEYPNDIRFRTRGEELVPYMEIELPKELLTGIYVGYRCDFERTKKAIELCTAHNYNVEIKKSLIK